MGIYQDGRYCAFGNCNPSRKVSKQSSCASCVTNLTGAYAMNRLFNGMVIRSNLDIRILRIWEQGIIRGSEHVGLKLDQSGIYDCTHYCEPLSPYLRQVADMALIQA